MGLLVAFPQSSAGQVRTVPDWHPGRDQGLQVGHPPAPPFEPVALQTVNEAQLSGGLRRCWGGWTLGSGNTSEPWTTGRPTAGC